MAIANTLAMYGTNLVVLSGYLRPIGPNVLSRYSRRIVNVHPALLPKFGGQGMYGPRVHEAVLASGETMSGATIHLVDSDYDHGQIIAQAEVPVLFDDDVESLARRVEEAETQLFVQTLSQIAGGSITLG
jgi:phosphoribosylglycinamide formyltransferase-1